MSTTNTTPPLSHPVMPWHQLKARAVTWASLAAGVILALHAIVFAIVANLGLL